MGQTKEEVKGMKLLKWKDSFARFVSMLEKKGYILCLFLCFATVVLTALFTKEEKPAPVMPTKPAQQNLFIKEETKEADINRMPAKEAMAQTAKSGLSLPLYGRIIKTFSLSLRYDPLYGDYRAHPYVDFEGVQGQSVFACFDGTVTQLCAQGANGFSLTLVCGDRQALYWPLEGEGLPKVGDKIKKGDQIGRLFGKNKEAQILHFAYFYEGKENAPVFERRE